MQHHYYIIKDVSSSDKEDLKDGVRIFKTSVNHTVNHIDGNGPYKSIRSLKRNSLIFKTLQQINSKRAQQIFLDKNICDVKGVVIHQEGHTMELDFIYLMEHALKGKIIGNKVTGVHYFDSERMRIKNLLNTNEVTQVWEAEIEFMNPKTNQWIRKETSTTFFPISWSEHQLFDECEYAYKKMIKKEGAKNVYTSRTLSNIEVEIIKIGEEVKSMYPLL